MPPCAADSGALRHRRAATLQITHLRWQSFLTDRLDNMFVAKVAAGRFHYAEMTDQSLLGMPGYPRNGNSSAPCTAHMLVIANRHWHPLMSFGHRKSDRRWCCKLSVCQPDCSMSGLVSCSWAMFEPRYFAAPSGRPQSRNWSCRDLFQPTRHQLCKQSPAEAAPLCNCHRMSAQTYRPTQSKRISAQRTLF